MSLSRQFGEFCKAGFASDPDLKDFGCFRYFSSPDADQENSSEVGVADLDGELFLVFAVSAHSDLIPVVMTIEPLLEVPTFLGSLVNYAADAAVKIDVLHTIAIENPPMMSAVGIRGAVLLEASTLGYLDFLPSHWEPLEGRSKRILMPVFLDRADYEYAKVSRQGILERLDVSRRDLMSVRPVVIPGE